MCVNMSELKGRLELERGNDEICVCVCVSSGKGNGRL